MRSSFLIALFVLAGPSLWYAPASAADGQPAENSAEQTGALSPALLDQFRRGYEIQGGDAAIFNAVTNNGINELALNRSIVRGHDGHFSNKIKFKGITNQKASGRCWLFAGLNTMRPRVIEAKHLDKFEFSAAYLQFYDKLEKSNNYLEAMIEMRDRDFLDRDWELVHEWALSDGGWWNYVVALIDKYGVVPAQAMPETHSSENTRDMNRVLERLLRARAVELHRRHHDGASLADLRKYKQQVLGEVYRLLALNLGEPPTEFEWRYEPKPQKAEGDDQDQSEDKAADAQPAAPAKKYTPQQFYREFVGVDLSQYRCLYSDPNQPTSKHLRFDRARNIYGASDMHFVNVTSDALKDVCQSAILANEPVWFAADVGHDQSSKLGIMADGLYDYSTLFDLKLEMTKAERIRYHAGGSNHAMVFMGVDIRDGKPVKWLVENSWGADKGERGTWTIYDGWFNEHVYAVIVHQRHLSKDVLAAFEEPAKVLPTWYPGAPGLK